jgi:dihydrofolate synthase/folylpolyglutamate synthase
MGRVTVAPGPAADRLDRPIAEDPLLRRVLPELAVGVDWTLERTQQALASVGDPQRAFRSLHVGGTNGKGSVTATLASTLRAAGHRVGAYTSPHLRTFRERMLVDGAPIDEERLVGYGSDVRDAILRYGLTFFEAATVLAFHAFREERVEVAAVEVGLGGRLDATNVLLPDVTGVTNIANDHAEYLGDTLQEIAREKAGIMKRGVPFVTTETDPNLLGLFEALAGDAGTRVIRVPSDVAQNVVVTAEGTRFETKLLPWGKLEIFTPLVGSHQVTNTLLALEMLAQAPDGIRPSREELLAGIQRVRHHGRGEVRVVGGRTWLLDVAHNPAGVASLIDTMDRLHLRRPLVTLVGVLADKDWRAMLTALRARSDAVVLTVPPTAPVERRWDPSTVVTTLGAEGVSGQASLLAEDDFARALERAAALAPMGTVVVTGSVHTVGSAMTTLGIDPLG